MLFLVLECMCGDGGGGERALRMILVKSIPLGNEPCVDHSVYAVMCGYSGLDHVWDLCMSPELFATNHCEQKLGVHV